MDAPEDLQFLAEEPCVVIDEVSMRYRVPSSETVPGSRNGIGGLMRRITGKPNLVTVNALKPMSLVAVRGESIGIVGRNGSGKSTLMKLIAGQANPDTGAVYASSTPIMLGVNAALVPELPGDHNVVLGCLAMGLTYDQIAERYESIVELSGLEKAIHLPMRSYSSGMSSRLRFAIAASIDPEILLIDEALNTGDAQFADRSRKRMDELRENAGCVFLVSHSLETITEMCSRVVWMDKGDLLMDGEPRDVVKAYKDFTRHLSKGNNISAAKIRTDAMEALTVTRIQERSTGRRSAKVQ
ncbi:ABC transporter ATP-binding protein [Arthrobacter zhangbolii]|uniref:ABC transporter ATP-binding protein n=1 Tax=Arthrobacter zhangbolii TaxID=2886936 RepID=A0A9X1S7U8_9MICC|nr:ABC transporter ATP-binding protein [Arthrobacter zhangbolii]MCC3271138.1 ABC transporter ATP-binding protein [Arthrobacter zhangbolii]UON91066.1 ABC transporter ATP-binding protein [Arthrobacter zhangbolii]